MGASRPLVALLVCARAARANEANEANETECRSLGFSSTLLCSSCSKLGEFVGESDPLIGECQGCCKDEADNSGVMFAGAVLDVCR